MQMKILGSALGLAIAGAGLLQTTNAVAETTVKMSYFPSFTSLPIMVAQKTGLFEREGLKVDLVQITSGGAIETALVSGSVDFVINPPQLHLQTIEKGQDVRMFLNNFKAPIWSVVFTDSVLNGAAPESYPGFVKHLKGKKVGVTGRGSLQEIIWRLMLEDAGLDPDRDVSFIAIGSINTALPALRQDQVQAYLASEPMQTMIRQAEKPYAQIVLDLWKGEGPAELRENWVTNVWATSGKTAEQRPGVVRQVSSAIRAAHAWMQDPANLEELVEIAYEISPTDKSILVKAIPGVVEVMGPELSRESVEAVNRFLVSNGLLKAPIPYEKSVIVVAP